MNDALPGIPHDQVHESSLSGDVEALVSMFADDAILMPPNENTIFGKDEIRAWWKQYFAFFRVTSSVETDREVLVAGAQALVRAAFSVTIVPRRGARIVDDIRSLTVWKQGPDGRWKISHQIWNSTNPVGSGTNRYMRRMLQEKGAKSS